MRIPKTSLPMQASKKRIDGDGLASLIECLVTHDGARDFSIIDCSLIKESAGQYWREISFAEDPDDVPYRMAVLYTNEVPTSIIQAITPKGSEFDLSIDTEVNPPKSIPAKHFRLLAKMLEAEGPSQDSPWAKVAVPEGFCPECWNSRGRQLKVGCCFCTGDVKTQTKETTKQFAESFKTGDVTRVQVTGYKISVEVSPGSGAWSGYGHQFNRGETKSGLKFPDEIKNCHGIVEGVSYEEALEIAERAQAYHNEIKLTSTTKPGSPYFNEPSINEKTTPVFGAVEEHKTKPRGRKPKAG